MDISEWKEFIQEQAENLSRSDRLMAALMVEILDQLRAIRQATEAQDEEEGATHLGDMSGTFVPPQSLNGNVTPPYRNPVPERE